MRRIVENPEKEVARMAMLNRENQFHHMYYDEDMKQYILMKNGDPAAVEESAAMMRRNLVVPLATDPVTNVRYLFVANTTLTTRFAIEGGMDSEKAYNASDLYISRLASCHTVEEVLSLHREMFSYFTDSMAALRKEHVYSKPVIRCMEYIDTHLHTTVRLKELADAVNLNPSYLSTLFREETGRTVSEYILARRISTAQNLLLYTDYSTAVISDMLAFSSQSYMIRVFKKQVGMTPRTYRLQHYRDAIEAAK